MPSRNTRLLPLFTLLTLLALGLPQVQAQASPNPAAVSSRRVLAFYYLWYETSDWAKPLSANPVASYSSGDRATIERQVDEAKAAGIDTLVANWWGQDGRVEPRFGTLLEVAAAKGVTVACLYEVGMGGPGNAASNLAYLRDTYQSSAAYLKEGGKAVVFFYGQAAAGEAGTWGAIRQQVDPQGSQLWIAEGDKGQTTRWLGVFNGLYPFSANYWAGPTRDGFAREDGRMRDAVKREGEDRLFVAAVQPGYDDTRMTDRSRHYRNERNGGEYFRASFGGAIDANPDWIVVATYNEWFEGTQIEPDSREGRLYLEISGQYAAQYKGVAPPPVPPAPPTNPPAIPPLNGCSGRLFSETNHCLTGYFKSYWEKNGGLAQFGFPITDATNEVNRTDGHTYRTQWFERARFEEHPEYGDGTVLLGFLGRDAAERSGVARTAPFQPTSGKGGADFYPQSGHNLGSGFREYWRANGSLNMYGYPISEEFVETLGGKPFIVQYFERARFELHMENAGTPYVILLGALGNLLHTTP